MMKSVASVLVLGAIAGVTTASLTAHAATRPSNPDVTVHEWGTFTSVAGPDGRAIEWLPLGGPTDLPCFVERFGGAILKIAPTDTNQQLNLPQAQAAMWGKVRMETPVIYFYSDHDARFTVHVDFPRGLITEYYPSPTSQQLRWTANSLRDPTAVGYAEWRDLYVRPNLAPSFLTTPGASRYYAARATDAAPIQLRNQTEKFIFYRGVAGFDVPITTRALDNGGMQVTNVGNHGTLPTVILFERRGAAVGYRISEPLADTATLAAPVLDGSLVDLQPRLAASLVAAGLTQKEAAAMVETWRDSWFEQGTRVFYVLPQSAVDEILPLTITPSPAKTTRVFVGRMDVITPTTLRVVGQALAANDTTTLLGYSRFLSPITQRIIANGVDAATGARIRRIGQAVFTSYVERDKHCR